MAKTRRIRERQFRRHLNWHRKKLRRANGMHDWCMRYVRGEPLVDFGHIRLYARLPARPT